MPGPLDPAAWKSLRKVACQFTARLAVGGASWPRLRQKRSPERPPSFEPFYGEVLLRALVRVVPGLFVYFGHGGEGHLEGGYTVRTPDGRPLIGELPIEGAYLLGALADYGAVAAPAAGKLLAELIAGEKPTLEPGPFAPGRYL